MPSTRSSLRGSFSMMSSVSRPNSSTMRFAITGPTPLIRPLPRYFSMAKAVAGLLVR